MDFIYKVISSMPNLLRYISISLLFLFSQTVFANNYQKWVDDITQRLNHTEQLLKENKIDDAKTEVQMAYFEVFENLEGPIRINFSAQKSYQMEATFGEIRKMIGEGKPMNEVQAKINGLKNELQQFYLLLLKGINSMLIVSTAFMIIKPSNLIGNKVSKPLMILLLKPLPLMKGAILPMLKKHFNKLNMTATKILKWKCRSEPTALLKFQQQSINNSII